MPDSKKNIDSIKTIVIENFGAGLTRYPNGKLDSGMARYATTHSIDIFTQPKVLRFMENAVQIDASGSVIVDCIVAGKPRIESGITYLYAVGHLGNVYKIQVNNPTGFNPNYDTPVLLHTLTNSQTFNYGASIEFYGSTEQIWIGCDQGVTRINFDGSSETVVGDGSAGDWVQNVPRQVVKFAGNLYYTNGSNIANINSSLIVNTYTQLSPGFPANMVAKDIRFTNDGRYIVIVVTRTPALNIISYAQDTSSLSNNESDLFYWNGSDTAASSFTTFPAFAQTSYFTFANNEYNFGYDLFGANLATPTQKVYTLQYCISPLPNAISANGNLLQWMTPAYDSGFLKANLFMYGNMDEENPNAQLFRHYRAAATSPSTDVLAIPFMMPVTNPFYGFSTDGYAGNLVGNSKIYYSTIEFDGTTPKYRFYYFLTIPMGNGTSAPGVYETQTELFTKSVKISELRVYAEPAVPNQSFQIDIIGIDGKVINNASRVFSITGATMIAGQTLMNYTPTMNPTTAIGIRVTNLGTVTPAIHKIEFDVDPFGK